jgi:hypothetical protein
MVTSWEKTSYLVVQTNNPDRSGNFYDLDPGLREKIPKLNELDACTYVNGVRRFRRLCEQVRI